MLGQERDDLMPQMLKPQMPKPQRPARLAFHRVR